MSDVSAEAPTAMGKGMRGRTNVLHRRAEAWRPPPLAPSRTPLGRALGALRRFLDLQYGTIWRDLAHELRSRGTAVDVGCGGQPYRGLFPSDVRYVGIDTVHARERFGYALHDTVYYDGDRWPIDGGAADLVLCTETLEHVPEPAALLAEARRCLWPGGRLLLTVPFAARWNFVPHDYWRFTPSGLGRLLEGAGFADVAVYARGNAATVACYKAMALILPLLAPQAAGPLRALGLRLLGLALSPLLLGLAVAGNLSLLAGGGDDCLGYTATAVRPKGDPEGAPQP